MTIFIKKHQILCLSALLTVVPIGFLFGDVPAAVDHGVMVHRNEQAPERSVEELRQSLLATESELNLLLSTGKAKKEEEIRLREEITQLLEELKFASELLSAPVHQRAYRKVKRFIANHYLVCAGVVAACIAAPIVYSHIKDKLREARGEVDPNWEGVDIGEFPSPNTLALHEKAALVVKARELHGQFIERYKSVTHEVPAKVKTVIAKDLNAIQTLPIAELRSFVKELLALGKGEAEEEKRSEEEITKVKEERDNADRERERDRSLRRLAKRATELRGVVVDHYRSVTQGIPENVKAVITHDHESLKKLSFEELKVFVSALTALEKEEALIEQKRAEKYLLDGWVVTITKIKQAFVWKCIGLAQGIPDQVSQVINHTYDSLKKLSPHERKQFAESLAKLNEEAILRLPIVRYIPILLANKKSYFLEKVDSPFVELYKRANSYRNNTLTEEFLAFDEEFRKQEREYKEMLQVSKEKTAKLLLNAYQRLKTYLTNIDSMTGGKPSERLCLLDQQELRFLKLRYTETSRMVKFWKDSKYVSNQFLIELLYENDQLRKYWKECEKLECRVKRLTDSQHIDRNTHVPRRLRSDMSDSVKQRQTDNEDSETDDPEYVKVPESNGPSPKEDASTPQSLTSKVLSFNELSESQKHDQRIEFIKAIALFVKNKDQYPKEFDGLHKEAVQFLKNEKNVKFDEAFDFYEILGDLENTHAALLEKNRVTLKEKIIDLDTKEFQKSLKNGMLVLTNDATIRMKYTAYKAQCNATQQSITKVRDAYEAPLIELISLYEKIKEHLAVYSELTKGSKVVF